MHTFKATDGTVIHYNSDLSGHAHITPPGAQDPSTVSLKSLREFVAARADGKAKVVLPKNALGPQVKDAALKEFAGESLADEVVSRLEQLSPREISRLRLPSSIRGNVISRLQELEGDQLLDIKLPAIPRTK